MEEAGGMARCSSENCTRSKHPEIDRLSDLPDNSLHHILSFLETKFTVRTSLLSTRWRSLWKEVPALNFGSYISRWTHCENYISNLLSLRSNDASIASISFDFGDCYRNGQPDIEPFDRIMRYATGSCGGSGLGLLHLSIACEMYSVNFGRLAAHVESYYQSKSLRTLKLINLMLVSDGRSPAFGIMSFLTTLELHGCDLFFCPSSKQPHIDPFAGLPYLNYLKLIKCKVSTRVFRISGPQLQDLQIEKMEHSSEKVEVFAPKLKSFRYLGPITQLVKLSAPSLDQANIRIFWDSMQTEELHCKYMKLLGDLHNAKSVGLCFDKILWKARSKKSWQEHEFPLTSMASLMKLKASPFTRLESLRVQYPQAPPKTPDEVLSYFFKRYPDMEGRVVQIEEKKPMLDRTWYCV